jgi:hypothetical protein
MAPKRGIFTFFRNITNESNRKIFNQRPSYIVGEARRATSFGLARLPNIYFLEMVPEVFSVDARKLFAKIPEKLIFVDLNMSVLS